MAGLLSIGSMSAGDLIEATERIYLSPLNEKGDIDNGRLPDLVLQHWPDTFSDTRSADRSSYDVIGSSHPLYEWSRGSARTVNLDAIFVRDLKPPDFSSLNPLELLEALAKEALSSSNDFRNPNIKAALAWLRSFTYPEYVGDQVIPPPPVLLHIPNSGIGTGGLEDEIVAYITMCNITYEEFFYNGEPRVVTVNLSLMETIQRGGSISLKSRNEWFELANLYNLSK